LSRKSPHFATLVGEKCRSFPFLLLIPNNLDMSGHPQSGRGVYAFALGPVIDQDIHYWRSCGPRIDHGTIVRQTSEIIGKWKWLGCSGLLIVGVDNDFQSTQ
jgi:hypothetical protein